MVEQIKEYGSVLALVVAVITQIYAAAKIIAKNDYTIQELTKFRNDYDEHIKDYQNLARDVAFLKGRDNVH